MNGKKKNQNPVTDNPFRCQVYMTAGENHSLVEKTREVYTAQIVYEGGYARTGGFVDESHYRSSFIFIVLMNELFM